MKFLRIPLLVLMLTAAFGITTARADVKIGAVSMARLLQQSPQAQAATKDMEQKFDSRRKALLAEQDKIKSLQDQINKNGAIMSAAQLQDLQNQLDNLQQDFGHKQSAYFDDLNTARNEQLGKIQRDILKAVQEFAQTQKYNMIIGEGVFYADSTVDVTDQVLVQLQKDFQAKPAAGGN